MLSYLKKLNSSQKFDSVSSSEQISFDSAKTVAQRKLENQINNSSQTFNSSSPQKSIDSSPYMVAQRNHISGLFGNIIQQKKDDDEKSKQLKNDEEKSIQLKKEDLVPKIAKSDKENYSEKTSAIPDKLKTGIENLSGISMSDVKVHYNSSQPAQLKALAFAQDNDIHLGEDQEKYLPHEAWHLVQQRQGRVNSTMQFKEIALDDNSVLENEADVMGQKALEGTAPGIVQKADAVAEDPIKKRVKEIEDKYKAMIKSSRDKGYNVAADMLQRFLDGTGGTATLSVSWLRSFSEVTDAEDVNHKRFEKTLKDKAYTLKDGESLVFSDHWDKMLTSSVLKELYYASGTSTLTSTGSFTLSRKGNFITITGNVGQRWHDPYDWHGGLGAYIPGYGVISDDDALFLQDHGKAKSFDMESNWSQTLNGSVEIINWWPDSVNFDWKGP